MQNTRANMSTPQPPPPPTPRPGSRAPCIFSALFLWVVNMIRNSGYHCFAELHSMQGSKISDKSHNQETTDLHKCISRIHRCTPDHEKTNVSSRLPFKLGTFVIAISDLFMSYNVKTQYLLKFQIYRLLLWKLSSSTTAALCSCDWSTWWKVWSWGC